MTPRIEGYWRQHRDDPAGLPWPEPTPGWGEADFEAFITATAAQLPKPE